jgi:HAMP domain-containing protein
MKVATQNLILVAPIFLLLSVITGLLLFVSERHEVRWGLESEALGLAQTIAGFTDPSVLPAGGPAVQSRIDRIVKFGQARRIEVADLTAGRPRLVAEAGEAARGPASLDAHTLERVIAGQSITRPAPGAADRLLAASPIRGRDDRVSGVVTVEIDITALATHRALVASQTAIISIVLLAVGGLVSLVLSRIISRELARLTRTAEAFAAGHYEAGFTPGVIDEVNVVGSTFGIMGSVLRDATDRSTREMLQLERFNTDRDLTECYADRFAAPISSTHGGFDVAADRLGAAAHGDFWFVTAAGHESFACLGCVDGPSSLETLTVASAAGVVIQEALSGGVTPADAMQRAAAIFPVHCAMVAAWRTGDRRVSIHRLDSAGALHHTSTDIARGQTAVMTTLDDGSNRKAVRYAAGFAFESPVVCVRELQRFLGGAPGGVLALQG